MKHEIHTQNAPAAIGPYSQAIQCNNMLFSSGQIAINPDNGQMTRESIEAETHQVLKNIEALLIEANISWGDIIKTSIFLKDMNDFEKVNAIYSEYMIHPFPARETVQVAKLPMDARIEISFIAQIES